MNTQDVTLKYPDVLGLFLGRHSWIFPRREKVSKQCPQNSSDWQDKYVIGPICLISSRTEMSNVASNTMYAMCTQSQTDISSVL